MAATLNTFKRAKARPLATGAVWGIVFLVALLALVGLAQPSDAVAGSGADEPAISSASALTDAQEMRRALAQDRLALFTVKRTLVQRLLARPPDGLRDWYGSGYRLVSKKACGPRVCVHWVPGTIDAPPLDDTDSDGRPDWVESSLTTVEELWRVYHDVLGYRETLADDNDDDQLDGRLDVFLADIGADGLYGYAASDDPNLFERFYPFYNMSTYIVLDNDFAPEQFDEGASGIDAFNVAAAHELHHAFQYAYDIADDNWFAQASASWIEDEVFDDIDLNRVWLPFSALGRPDVPIDFGEGPFQYANWIFLRYLSERFGPDVIRDAWALADGSSEGIDLYSVKAIKKAVRMRGAQFPQVFADFGVANRIPALSYEEGAHYPVAPELRSYRLKRTGATIDWTRTRLDHLTNQYLSFVPTGALPNSAKIRLDVRIPKRAWGRAAAILHSPGGEASVWRISVDKKGRGSRRLPFSPADVARVDLVLTNASIAYRCWQFYDSPFACFGKPLHDDLEYRFRAHVVR